MLSSRRPFLWSRRSIPMRSRGFCAAKVGTLCYPSRSALAAAISGFQEFFGYHGFCCLCRRSHILIIWGWVKTYYYQFISILVGWTSIYHHLPAILVLIQDWARWVSVRNSGIFWHGGDIIGLRSGYTPRHADIKAVEEDTNIPRISRSTWDRWDRAKDDGEIAQEMMFFA